MSSQSLKRGREDELDSELFTHHHVKKPCPSWHTVQNANSELPSPIDQALRFRASTITPIDSSDEEGDNKARNNLSLPAASARATHHNRPPALQFNISSAAGQFSVLAGGDHLSPWLPNAQATSTAQSSPIPHAVVDHSLSLHGPQPTGPTTGYFPTSVSHTNQSDHDNNMMEDVSFHAERQPPVFIARPPTPASEADASMSWQKSEDTEMDYFQTSGHMPKPSTPPPISTEQYSQQTFEDLMKQAAASTPSHRKRPALVMGFRADCEQCRCRVPGHYNHILRN